MIKMRETEIKGSVVNFPGLTRNHISNLSSVIGNFEQQLITYQVYIKMFLFCAQHYSSKISFIAD